MALHGHVYYITEPSQAFVPVVLGDTAPTTGFVPWGGVTVEAIYFWDFLGLEFPVWVASTHTAHDGSYTLPEPSAGLNGIAQQVALRVVSGVTVYRSSYMSRAHALSRPLDMWIYVDRLPVSDGITAGTVSQQINGHGLPGNTRITAGGPYGLNFRGSEGQVDINFNIWTAPDVSCDLNAFLDLSLNGYDIEVGWPTDWFESPGDVLNKIRSGIASAGSSINTAVLNRMASILETSEGLTAGLANNFLHHDVSTTFFGISYPHAHNWGIGETGDNTVVLTANACIGFPRSF